MEYSQELVDEVVYWVAHSLGEITGGNLEQTWGNTGEHEEDAGDHKENTA